jgi:hypothetical protein
MSSYLYLYLYLYLYREKRFPTTLQSVLTEAEVLYFVLLTIIPAMTGGNEWSFDGFTRQKKSDVPITENEAARPNKGTVGSKAPCCTS